MPYRFMDEWLGCLTEPYSIALWSCAAEWVGSGFTYISPDAVYEVLEPDCYMCNLPYTVAFKTIFGLIDGTITIGEDTFPAIFPINPIQFTESCVYILSFLPDFSNAPCTQETFP